MFTNLANCRVAALNLYNASRELPMKAKEHELMGTSHDALQQLTQEAEKAQAAMEGKDKEIESLKNVIRELEKMGGKAPAPAGAPTPEGEKT